MYNLRHLALTVLMLAATPLAAEPPADPMRPPAASTAPAKSGSKAVPYYYLNSILISPSHRSAIINGRRVGIGDRVGNAKVVAIQGNEVTLSIAGRTRVLTLIPVSIKKPVEASRQ